LTGGIEEPQGVRLVANPIEYLAISKCAVIIKVHGKICDFSGGIQEMRRDAERGEGREAVVDGSLQSELVRDSIRIE
jgi:hypothetical protein